MPEPLGIISGIGSSLGGIVTAAKFVCDLKNTRKDVKACLLLVTRVYDDIQYLVELRNKNLKLLDKSHPVGLARLDRIIADAENSILDVGRLLEPCRREAHGGKVPFMGRMEWVLGGSSALVLRMPNLQQQHVAIVAEIGWLRQLEGLKPLQEFAESNTIYDNTNLWSPGRRRLSSIRSSISEGTSEPPAYSPREPAHSTIPEEDGHTDFVSEIYQSSFGDGNQPSRQMRSMSFQPFTTITRNETVMTEEEEDTESAYYRDIAMQQQERQRRRVRERNSSAP